MALPAWDKPDITPGRLIAGPVEGSPGGAADGRDLELENDLLTYQDAASLKRCVPVHAPVLAVDRGLPFEPDAMVAKGIHRGTGVFELDGNGLGHALDREITGDLEGVVRRRFHRR